MGPLPLQAQTHAHTDIFSYGVEYDAVILVVITY